MRKLSLDALRAQRSHLFSLPVLPWQQRGLHPGALTSTSVLADAAALMCVTEFTSLWVCVEVCNSCFAREIGVFCETARGTKDSINLDFFSRRYHLAICYTDFPSSVHEQIERLHLKYVPATLFQRWGRWQQKQATFEKLHSDPWL